VLIRPERPADAARIHAVHTAAFPTAAEARLVEVLLRFGFRAASEFGLFDEYRGGAAFQILELVRGALPVGGGLVRYAREFATLGA